jgi:RNA polymerase sigma-70 factor (ECF subfamily)
LDLSSPWVETISPNQNPRTGVEQVNGNTAWSRRSHFDIVDCPANERRQSMKKSLLASVSSLFSMTDEQAMWRVRTQDDAHAFAQLMRRWEQPIQRLCTRMLGDAHKGEDLAQDTFARLFAGRKEYEPSGRFSTFLWRVALNLCYDELRRRKRRPEDLLDPELLGKAEELAAFKTTQLGADAVLLESERGDLVRQAVLELSEAYRSVVVLRHYENLKFREIAEVLGIPEGTVKSRMAEALTQLHRALAQVLDERKPSLCKISTKRTEESLVP